MSKIDEPKFKQLFEKYAFRKLPSGNTIRQNYTRKIHRDCIEEARKRLYGKRIYAIIDESPDAAGNTVAAFVVGDLDDPENGPYMINLKDIDTSCNTEAYVKFFKESLDILYPKSKQKHISILLIYE